ncbi:hypothetical protein D3C73_863190 [compost metagenome]
MTHLIEITTLMRIIHLKVLLEPPMGLMWLEQLSDEPKTPKVTLYKKGSLTKPTCTHIKFWDITLQKKIQMQCQDLLLKLLTVSNMPLKTV